MMNNHQGKSIPDVLFYCCINEKDWSHHPVVPGKRACISPVYGKEVIRPSRVVVPDEVEYIILDGGAFCDRNEKRLDFQQAYNRQIAHAYQYGYILKIQYMASYDKMGDAKESVRAAQWLDRQRMVSYRIIGRLTGCIMTAQGRTSEEYLWCTEQLVMHCMEFGDVLGLGGWSGQQVDPIDFAEVMAEALKIAGRAGVRRVHLWGVIDPALLGILVALGGKYVIQPSCDSSHPCRLPISGRWGYASWRNSAYSQPPILSSCKDGTCVPENLCRGRERARHTACTSEWLAHFRSREPALCQIPAYKQLRLLA